MEILQKPYSSGLVRPELLQNKEYLEGLWERNVSSLLRSGVHVLALGFDGEVAKGRYKDELRQEAMFFPQPETFSVRGLMEPFITDGRVTKEQLAILARKIGDRYQCCYKMELDPARVVPYVGIARPQRPFANYGQTEKLIGVTVADGRRRLFGDQAEECGSVNDAIFYLAAFPEVLTMRCLSIPGSDYRDGSGGVGVYAPAIGFYETMGFKLGPEFTVKPVNRVPYGRWGLFTRGKVQA